MKKVTNMQLNIAYST